jgi:polar amino acid transport system substrate-binding protein
MKRLAACVVFSLIGLGSAMAQGKCEPDKVAQKYPTLAGKTVKVATTPFYAPYSYADPKDNEKLVGSDIEISEAALSCVGLKFEYLKGVFSSLLQTVSSGQTDVMVANLYFTPERNKVVDFAVYMRGGGALLVRKGNPNKIKSMDDLCGLSTNAVAGSFSHPILQRQQEKCRADGKKELVIVLATETDAALRGLNNGRADFVLDNVGAAAVRVGAEPDMFEVAFTNVQEVVVGNAVKKGNEPLLQAYYDGLKAIQDNGTMDKIFDKYNLDRKLIYPVEMKK